MHHLGCLSLGTSGNKFDKDFVRNAKLKWMMAVILEKYTDLYSLFQAKLVKIKRSLEIRVT
jgi:hypothetical protein